MKETKRTQNTNETLSKVFKEVGEKHHYKDVEAEFTAFRDMKIKWTRSYSWIRFDVSDYLTDAPHDVLTSIAETIFGRIAGDENACYNEKVAEWVSSNEFVVSKQPTYIRRCRGLGNTTKGEVYDLQDSFDRLVEKGLIKDDDKIYMAWGPEGTGRRTGFSSVLMKTINMSKMLDNEEIPEDILDFSLYAQIAHIEMGFDPFSTTRVDEYSERLESYPEYKLIMSKMNDLEIKV